MYYQKGQLMCKWNAALICLTFRLRVGYDHLSQLGGFIWRHHKIEAVGVFRRFIFAFPVTGMVR